MAKFWHKLFENYAISNGISNRNLNFTKQHHLDFNKKYISKVNFKFYFHKFTLFTVDSHVFNVDLHTNTLMLHLDLHICTYYLVLRDK